MALHSLLDEGLVLPRLEARDRDGVLREMVMKLEARHRVVAAKLLKAATASDLLKILKAEEERTLA